MKPTIRCNDNLAELKRIKGNSVDLVYIDPPFFTQQHQGDYDDRWKSKSEYIEFMRPRLEEIHRVLKPSGSIYLHCDSNANTSLRTLLDSVFGETNFNNEIIWHYRRWGSKGKSFARMHDTIYFYTKSPGSNTFNQPFEPLSEQTMKRTKGMKVESTIGSTGKKNIKMLTDVKSPGAAMHDVWDIPLIAGQAKERTGYATQKPERLIERIMLASSNPGDVVLDAFAGSGTTCAAARKLGRKSICIDVNPRACKIMEARLK